MKAARIFLIGLVGSWGHAVAEPLVEGRVYLSSGGPAAGAQVLLFDLADLRAAPARASADAAGYFALPLGALPGSVLPERFELGVNYPNPFNPSTVIPYQLPAPMHVRLEVFNLLGQRIATLIDQERPAGFHTAVWDATNAAGEAVSAGVYLYRLSGDGAKLSRSMVLIDGQAGVPAAGLSAWSPRGPEAEQTAPVYGLTVSGPGLVPYVDPAFQVEARGTLLEVAVEAPASAPLAKVASGGLLGDVDRTGQVDFFDALLVALYSRFSSTVMPNQGDISLGDVDADGRVAQSDALFIAAYLNDPSDPSLPAGIGKAVGAVSSDRDVLVALYNATDGPKWTNSTNWLSDQPLGDWHGVTTSNGRVTKLELRENQLKGPIPPELANLAHLEYLELAKNELTGEIPAELANLANLTYLELRRNQLTGEIPAELGQLANLTYLDLGVNQLSGEIPLELANLAHLTWLDLAGNQLTGEIPAELAKLARLTFLNLAINQLTGEIPAELAKLANLRYLELRRNQLTGEIPAELAKLAKLTRLDLGWNQLSSPIPAELANLTNLEYLDLGPNWLTGEIPAELGDLANLTYLDLGGGSGNLLTGTIPPELGQLTKLTELYLSHTELMGTIPPELGQLANLRVLELQGNQLTGTIPPELGQLANLEWLLLGYNDLRGEIPPELGQLTKLTQLFLGFTGLSGPLPPEFADLSLELLDIREAEVCVPRAVKFQEWLSDINTRGSTLGVTHCQNPQWDALSALYDGTDGPNWTNKTNWQSTAPLGEWYGVTTDADGRVTELNLEDNNLSGTLPLTLGGLTNLKTLNLASNIALSGPLPQSITGLTLESLKLEGTAVCAPPQAKFQAWLNGMGISGSTGADLSDLFQAFSNESSDGTGIARCTDTRVDYYTLVELHKATDGPNWDDKTNWQSAAPLGEWYGVTTDASGRVTELILSDNNLRGPLLHAALGQLTNLSNLDLSGSQLTGEIPPELGQLTKLSNLDLSGNQLTGEIPPELGQLANLERLELSGNPLTGEIPPNWDNSPISKGWKSGGPR